MNLTVTTTPSIAELTRGVLEHRTLIAGQPFYAAGTGVIVVVAPLPPEEAILSGADHEFTVSTGFPPDPGAAGITVWLQRRGPTGNLLERLGETDRFGSLIFAAGETGCEYQLTVTRGSGVRLPVESNILPFPEVPETRTEPEVSTCPVCREGLGWTAKLTELREGLKGGNCVCRRHLIGPENVILAAARDGWKCQQTEVFIACGRLLADLLDENGAVREGFLRLYSADSHSRVLNQVAGLLSSVIAIGHLLAKNPGRAAAAGRAAAVHLQSVAGAYNTPCEGSAGLRGAEARDPLDGFFSRMALQINGELTRGFQEFRRLSASITQQ